MPGRPTKNKWKPKFDEGRDRKKKKKNFVERDFKQNKCRNYGELGHYKKNCKNPTKSNEASTSATPLERRRSKKHSSITPPTTSFPLQQFKPQLEPLNQLTQQLPQPFQPQLIVLPLHSLPILVNERLNMLQGGRSRIILHQHKGVNNNQAMLMM